MPKIESTDAEPLNVMDLFTSIHNGLVAASTLIFLILIVGGVLKVIESTGAISDGIYRLLNLAKGRQNVLIFIFCATFATLASVGVGANLVIAFVPIGLFLARSMKLDPIVGVAIIFLSSYAGFGTGVFYPTVTVTGQTMPSFRCFPTLCFAEQFLWSFWPLPSLTSAATPDVSSKTPP